MVLQAGWLAILQVLHQLGYSQPSHGWRRSQRKMEVSWPTKENEWDFWKTNGLFSYSRVISGLSYRGGIFRGGRKRILWKYLFQDISNQRTVPEGTPEKPEVSHSSIRNFLNGVLGIRSHSVLMDLWKICILYMIPLPPSQDADANNHYVISFSIGES